MRAALCVSMHLCMFTCIIYVCFYAYRLVPFCVCFHVSMCLLAACVCVCSCLDIQGVPKKWLTWSLHSLLEQSLNKLERSVFWNPDISSGVAEKKVFKKFHQNPGLIVLSGCVWILVTKYCGIFGTPCMYVSFVCVCLCACMYVCIFMRLLAWVYAFVYVLVCVSVVEFITDESRTCVGAANVQAHCLCWRWAQYGGSTMGGGCYPHHLHHQHDQHELSMRVVAIWEMLGLEQHAIGGGSDDQARSCHQPACCT